MRKLISLGQVCDVAFELRMHSGDNTTHFFDWLATPFAGLIHILENDFEVFYPEHLLLREIQQFSFVQDDITKVSFFHHFTAYGKRIPENFLAEYPQFIGKFKHLAARFRDTVRTQAVTLVRQNITFSQAEELEKVFFQQFPNTDVDFLYIVQPGESFVTAHGRAIEIESDPEKQGFGNIVLWAQMLEKEKIVHEPYRLSTVEVLTKDVNQHDFKGLGHFNRHSEIALKTACQHASDNPWFFYELALLYTMQKNWNKALRAIKTALRLAPDNVEFQRVELKVKANLNKFTPQFLAEELTRLLTFEPQQFALQEDLLNALMAIKDYENALPIADRLLLMDPLCARIYYQKADCLRKLEQTRLAELAIDKAIAMNADVAPYFTLKAELLATRGQVESAIEMQAKAVELNKNFSGLFYYGNLLFRAKRFAEAMTAYEEADKILPNNQALMQRKLQTKQALAEALQN